MGQERNHSRMGVQGPSGWTKLAVNSSRNQLKSGFRIATFALDQPLPCGEGTEHMTRALMVYNQWDGTYLVARELSSPTSS